MQFDDQFFQDIGFGNATEEERAEIIAKLAELVQSRIAVKLSEVLDEEQLAYFDELLQKSGEDAAVTYVEEVYPAYNELMQSEIDRAKQEFVSDVQQVAAKLDEQSPAA
jgi:hypothetical protein